MTQNRRQKWISRQSCSLAYALPQHFFSLDARKMQKSLETFMIKYAKNGSFDTPSRSKLISPEIDKTFSLPFCCDAIFSCLAFEIVA